MIQELIIKNGIRLREREDISSIKNKLSKCERISLTQSQKNDIQRFYRRVAGKEVPTYWHEYFHSRNGYFSVEYIPTSFYHKELIYRLNNYKLRHAYVDKGIYDIYFPDVNRPATIVKNINGFYYDASGAITQQEALQRCSGITEAIIKPSQEGMWGEGVNLIKSSDITDYHQLFDKYGKNFIIQERIRQDEQMSLLNPTSLNTIRVLSYRNNDGVFILYTVVRIGRLGKNIDNETAGGINADIDMATGRIKDCAYGTPSEKRIECTDCGTLLKGFEIPSYSKVIAKVKELHERLPYFRLVGWDWGIDSNSEPVLIEWNRAPDLSQTAHGPAFGEMTQMIIKETLKLEDSRYF